MGLWSVHDGDDSRHAVSIMSAKRLLVRAFIATMAVLAVAACGSDGDTALVGIVRDTPLQVGAVEVTDVTSQGAYADHDGTFTMKARPGRLLVVYFGYTNCPDLCPTTMAALRGARRDLGDKGDKFDVAMMTVDPARDTAEVLNGFLSSFGEFFHALRPESEAELVAAEEPFLASSSVVTNDDGSVEVGHSATAYVVDENGTVLVEWPYGIGKDGMANDLAILLRNA